jgi:RimJ/RimL family protein N-acetyltransferase
MAFGWEGESVRLVPLDQDKHLENALLWMNDPDVTRWLLVGDFPISRLAEIAYFEARSKQDESDIAWAIETLDGRHIGFSGLHRISHFHKTAISGTVLGDPNDWGKGLGTDAARVRARYAFEVLWLRMVQSGVLEGNDRSIGMQKKVGYEIVGCIPKKYWKRGAFRDEIVTCLTRERFAESEEQRAR